MRVRKCHLFFTVQGCKDPKALGLEEGIIKDSQITASSEHSQGLTAKNGRLNFQGQAGRSTAWAAKSNDDQQWLQVDLQYQVFLTGISSQGRINCACNQWVKSYTVSYSINGTYFIDVMQNCDIKVWMTQICSYYDPLRGFFLSLECFCRPKMVSAVLKGFFPSLEGFCHP